MESSAREAVMVVQTILATPISCITQCAGIVFSELTAAFGLFRHRFSHCHAKSLEMYLRLHLFGAALERAPARKIAHRRVGIDGVNAGYHNVG